MPTPPPAPAERFAAMLQWMSNAIFALPVWGRVVSPLIPFLIDRLRHAKWRFVALAARIAGGTYQPRARPAKTHHRQPPKNPLPTQFGWLLPLAPEIRGYHTMLHTLLLDPEMQALMAAAPAPMGRILRPLCRMLAVVPPAILVPPRRPRVKKPAAPSPLAALGREADQGRGEGEPPTRKSAAPQKPQHPFLRRKPSANWPGQKIVWPE